MHRQRTVFGSEELRLIRATLFNARRMLSTQGPGTLDFAGEKAEIDAALMLIGRGFDCVMRRPEGFTTQR